MLLRCPDDPKETVDEPDLHLSLRQCITEPFYRRAAAHDACAARDHEWVCALTAPRGVDPGVLRVEALQQEALHGAGLVPRNLLQKAAKLGHGEERAPAGLDVRVGRCLLALDARRPPVTVRELLHEALPRAAPVHDLDR